MYMSILISLRFHTLYMSRCAYSFTSSICTLRWAPTTYSETCFFHSFYLYLFCIWYSSEGPLFTQTCAQVFNFWVRMHVILTPLFWTFPELTSVARELRQIDWIIDPTGAYFLEEIWWIVRILIYFFTCIRICLIIAHLLLFSNFQSIYSHTLIYQVSNSTGSQCTSCYSKWTSGSVTCCWNLSGLDNIIWTL